MIVWIKTLELLRWRKKIKSIEYSTSDGRNCQVNDQFLESFVEGTEDSSISLENNSENGKVSLETLADFSTDILCLN